MPVAAVLGSAVFKGVAGKVVGAVAGKVIGGVFGKKAASGANARADALSAEATASARSLQDTSDRLGEQATDRWDFYKEHGENVDILLLDDAVKMFKETFAGGSERAAARAAEDVASAFDRSAEVRRRAAFRFGGVDPSSGKFQGLERETATARATQEASARFNARRSEEDRARAVLNNASDVANRSLDQSARFDSLGIAAGSRAGQIFAGGVSDARAEAAGSAELVGDIAGRIPFDDIFNAAAGGDSGSGVSDSGPSGSSTGNDIASVENDDPIFKKGGKIPGYRNGGVIPHDGRRGGRILGPGTGRSDSVKATVDGSNQPIRLSAGEFIIPAHVVRKKGDQFFNQLIRG